jgi:hypothetical protein
MSWDSLKIVVGLNWLAKPQPSPFSNKSLLLAPIKPAVDTNESGTYTFVLIFLIFWGSDFDGFYRR